MISRQQWLFRKSSVLGSYYCCRGGGYRLTNGLPDGQGFLAKYAHSAVRRRVRLDYGNLVVSPKTKTEETTFSVFSPSVATFVGGFVVAKVDQVYDANVHNGVMSEQFLIGVLLFSTAFGIGLLFTFVGRLADDVFK